MGEMLYLLAHVGGRGIAFDATQVESVIDVGPLVPVPGAAAGVRGLAALRSRVVTVVDTWTMLGLPTPDVVPTRAVIVRDDGFDYALLVDAVEDVAPFATHPVDAGTMLGEGWSNAATGVIEHGGGPVLVVDPCRLLPRAA